MGKRSSFHRRPMDDYDTPIDAVYPVIDHLRAVDRVRTYAEPCCGDGYLVKHLDAFGFDCVHWGDIRHGHDALKLTRDQLAGCDAIVTNPPWTRELLHPLIEHFMVLKPTWLLFDADWAFTRQATPYLKQCSTIVAVGRVKWIAGSPHSGKDNAAWYRFSKHHTGGPRFFGR